MLRELIYSSALCGAGKTHQIVRLSDELTRKGENVLILQPTKLLINKTKLEEFDKLYQCPPVKIFHSDIVGENVAKKLAGHLAEPGDCPQVVMATQQAFLRMPFVRNAKNWHLVFDESPQVDREFSYNVPSTHGLLTDHIEVEQYDPIYGRVKITNKRALQIIARNVNDDVLLNQFREAAAALVNRHSDTFVNIELYHKLLSGNAKTLTFHSILNPSLIEGFASVFVVSANFEDGAMYHLWSRRNVRFVANNAFTDSLRYSSHSNGKLVTIHYGIDGNWSRNLMQKTTEGSLNIEKVRDAAAKIVGSRPFLWQANKSVPDSFMNGQRLPHNSLGLNGFSNVHDIVFLPALNPSPAHSRFLKAQGLSDLEINRQGYFAAAYQTVMRTSLRDTADMNSKNIVVADERLAQYLCEMLPGARLERIETGIAEGSRRGGRPQQYQNNADKFRKRRRREKEDRAQLVNRKREAEAVQIL